MTSTTLPEPTIPECIMRDNLTSPYFPNTSKAVLAVVMALSAIFALTSFNRLNHTDLWGHLNFGRWIAQSHALPTSDPFAAPALAPAEIVDGAAPAAPLQSAWLAQLVGFFVQRAFGNEGLVFGHALLVTATAGIVMLAAVRRGLPLRYAWLAGLAMFLLDLPIVGTIRPQLFGQLGAALFLLATAELPGKRHPLVWVPVVAALWANLHGSILMGLVILGGYAVGSSWNLYVELGKDISRVLKDARLVRAWLAVVLAVAGASCGPHGPMLLVRTIFFGEHAALASITEWRRMTPTSLTGILMIASTAVTLLVAKYSPRKWQVYEVILLFAFGLVTLSAIRMLAWWAIVWPVLALPHAAAAWQKYCEMKNLPEPAPDEATSMRTLLALGTVFMTLLIAPPSFALITGVTRGESPSMVTDTPLYIADEVVRRDLSGNIAAPMDWADFLIWKTEGRLKPLVYSHVHLTEIHTWKDYESIFRGDELWLHVLQNHDMKYLLVHRRRSPDLARLVLAESKSDAPKLRIIYQDQRAVLAELIPAPAEAIKKPATVQMEGPVSPPSS